MVVNRYEAYLVNLDPAIGKEIQKTRPYLIISPDEMNNHIATVIIAPMTTKGRDYPTRVNFKFEGKNGQIVLDQIRTIDMSCLVKKLGKISTSIQKEVLVVLLQMFSE